MQHFITMSINVRAVNGESEHYFQHRPYIERFTSKTLQKILNLPSSVFDNQGDSQSDLYPRMLFKLGNVVKLVKADEITAAIYLLIPSLINYAMEECDDTISRGLSLCAVLS